MADDKNLATELEAREGRRASPRARSGNSAVSPALSLKDASTLGSSILIRDLIRKNRNERLPS